MAVYQRFTPQRDQAYVSQGLRIQAWQLPGQRSPRQDTNSDTQIARIGEGLTIRLRSNRRKQTRRAVSDLRETPVSELLEQTIVSTGPIIKPKRAKQRVRTSSLPKSPGLYLGCEHLNGLRKSKAGLPSMLMLRLVARPKRSLPRPEPCPRPKSRLITLDCLPPPSPQHQYSKRQRHQSETPLTATSPVKRSSPSDLDRVYSHPISPHRAVHSVLHPRESDDYDPDYEFSMQSYYLP